ncbi:MAG: TetR/AcrR family transcriptional regulator [Crocinitomicaceae bacterium]|nr:TetR/AcrR family transcriptional regulator [Crocinitomicaceae bacterium]
MPRVKLFNQEEALKKALMLFWEKGYDSTSLTDLTNELGIGKGSFYDTFGSKQELFQQALEAYRSEAFDTLDTLLVDKHNPVKGIRNFLDTHTEMMLLDPVSKGCFITNTCTGSSNDVFVQNYLKEHNRIMKLKLVDYLKHDSLSTNPELLADLILTQVTGISVLAKIINDKARFSDSNDLFMQLVK